MAICPSWIRGSPLAPVPSFFLSLFWRNRSRPLFSRGHPWAASMFSGRQRLLISPPSILPSPLPSVPLLIHKDFAPERPVAAFFTVLFPAPPLYFTTSLEGGSILSWLLLSQRFNDYRLPLRAPPPPLPLSPPSLQDLIRVTPLFQRFLPYFSELVTRPATASRRPPFVGPPPSSLPHPFLV